MNSKKPLFSLRSSEMTSSVPKATRRRNVVLGGLLAFSTISGSVAFAENEWANWRGPNYNGAALDAKPPSTWSSTSNIEWKIPLEGLGSSTPIVWGNQVIVHTAIEITNPENAKPVFFKPFSTQGEGAASGERGADATARSQLPPAQLPPERPQDRGPGGPDGIRGAGGPRGQGGPVGPGGGRMSSPKPTALHQFIVSSYDLSTGAKNWQTVVAEEIPHEVGHSTNNFASSSPVTDGKHIYSFFGSRGLFCLDMDGKKVWQVDLGDQKTRNEFGEASSAALYQDRVIVQWDHEGESFIAALDAKSGDLQWKTPREERTTWCTPLVVEHKGVVQVITNGRKIRSYDLANGQLIWEAGSLTENPIPSPMLYKDFIIATTGFRGAACYAISLDAKGSLEENSEFVKWTYHNNTPYVPSPVLYKDLLYFLSENKAILSCINATTGEPVFARSRLNGLETIYSSVGAADDKIYITGRNGTTVVVKAGLEKEIIATNVLGEEIDASPVFVGERLLLRSDKHLYSIRSAN